MTIADDKESLGLFEPFMVAEAAPVRQPLNDLALELAEKSAAFRSSLPAPIADTLAQLVRAMNCYYSNLIEGHDTHPIDIERALTRDYSADPKKRDLQLEAVAHIAAQRWIDEGGMVVRAERIPDVVKQRHGHIILGTTIPMSAGYGLQAVLRPIQTLAQICSRRLARMRRGFLSWRDRINCSRQRAQTRLEY